MKTVSIIRERRMDGMLTNIVAEDFIKFTFSSLNLCYENSKGSRTSLD